jgi:hypothetical protein
MTARSARSLATITQACAIASLVLCLFLVPSASWGGDPDPGPSCLADGGCNISCTNVINCLDDACCSASGSCAKIVPGNPDACKTCLCKIDNTKTTNCTCLSDTN